MDINEKVLGEINGQPVKSYNIINSNGLEVRVLNYGGIITDIIMADKNNNRENIVLKYKSLESYKTNPSYFGALIGRTGGRISNGEVELNGEMISFNKNYGLHQGHGGNEGFNTKFYSVKAEVMEECAYVELSRVSPDLEENYPGNLEVKVRYSLNEDDELKISYYGITDKDTLVNMTNHSYFNLSGNGKENILNHDLYINSKSIVELNEVQVPTGMLMYIEDTEYDFNSMKKIGKDIDGDNPQLKIGNGYDTPWYLEDGEGPALKLYHQMSGRNLEIYTDRKAIVVYTHNYPDDEVMENGKSREWRYGIAIEPQNPPIGVDSCFMEDSILKQGNEFNAETIYKFSIK